MPRVSFTTQELKLLWYAAEAVLHSEEGRKEFLDHIDEFPPQVWEDLQKASAHAYLEFDRARWAENEPKKTASG